MPVVSGIFAALESGALAAPESGAAAGGVVALVSFGVSVAAPSLLQAANTITAAKATAANLSRLVLVFLSMVICFKH